MKKAFLALVMIVLLASVPLDKWQQIPDKTEFLRLLGATWCEQTNCKKALIGVMEVGDKALFFGDCLDTKEVSL